MRAHHLNHSYSLQLNERTEQCVGPSVERNDRHF